MAGAGGFEPPHVGTKDRCLTAWLRPTKQKKFQKMAIKERVFLQFFLR